MKTGRNALWRTDGSTVGTFPLNTAIAEVQIGSGTSMQASTWSQTLGGRFYFGARTSADDDLELWSTDGTDAGTSRLVALPAPPGSQVSYFAKAGDRLLIFVQQIYGTDHLEHPGEADGTAEGTSEIASLQLGYAPEITGGDSLLYFSALNTGDPWNQAYELWVTDGTSSGTRMLTHFTPEQSLSNCSRQPRIVGDELLFCASTTPGGTQVWRSDGTSAGTFPLSAFGDVYPFAYYADTVEATKLAGSYYFLGYGDDYTYSLWRSPGTPGAAVRVRKIAGAGENLLDRAVARTGRRSPRLLGFRRWLEAVHLGRNRRGHVPSAETCAGSCPPFAGSAGVVGNRLFFVALDEAQHQQLWTTRDGGVDLPAQ